MVPGRYPLNERKYQLAAAGLILFFLSWDVWAAFSDNLVGTTDHILECMPRFHQLLDWMRTEVKGPLVPMATAALDLVVGFELVSARLLGVLCHGVVLVLGYLAARRLSSCSWAGLVAVLLCGSVPGIYGWFREEYHEAAVSMMLMLSLLLMTVPRLTLRRALLLGLVVGLGVLTKPAYLAYALLPGLVFLGGMLLRAQNRMAVLWGIAASLVVAGWWLVLSWDQLLGYAGRSTSGPGPEHLISDRFTAVLLGLHGAYPLVLGALLGGALCSYLGSVRPRYLLLYASAVVSTVLLMIVVFDPLSRYMMPMLPAAAVLAASGALQLRNLLLRWIPRMLVEGLLIAGAALLLGNFCVDNLRGLPTEVGGDGIRVEREAASGLISPDPRPYLKAVHGVAFLQRNECPVLELVDTERFCLHLEAIWKNRGVNFASVAPQDQQEFIQDNATVCIVLCHGRGPAAARLHEVAAERLTPRTARHVKNCRIEPWRTFSNPDGSMLTILKLHK